MKVWDKFSVKNTAWTLTANPGYIFAFAFFCSCFLFFMLESPPSVPALFFLEYLWPGIIHRLAGTGSLLCSLTTWFCLNGDPFLNYMSKLNLPFFSVLGIGNWSNPFFTPLTASAPGAKCVVSFDARFGALWASFSSTLPPSSAMIGYAMEGTLLPSPDVWEWYWNSIHPCEFSTRSSVHKICKQIWA